MIKSVDPYFKLQYTKDFTCLEFTAKVWFDLTGEDILKELKTFHAPVRNKDDRKATRGMFMGLDKPKSPCMVIMQRPGTIPHLGVFLRGRVLHIQPQGVEFQTPKVASRCFTKMRFFVCRP